MGATDKGAEERGCGCPDLGTYILGGVPVGNVLHVRDMGDDPTHQEGVERIPPQGGLQADREATLERELWRVDIPPAVGRNVGGSTAGGGDLHLPLP